MQVWRIAKRQYALDRQGIGAQQIGGRWNSPGVAVIYAGLTVEISAFEKLVHAADILPDDLVLVSIELPDDEALYLRLGPEALPIGWNDLPSSYETAKIGDEFASSAQKLGLIVPSAVLPEARNIVINPNHERYGEVKFKIVRPFSFDKRLRPAEQQ